MPKVTDTRIDDLIAHFENERDGYNTQYLALEREIFRCRTARDMADKALLILRNGNAPSEPQAKPDVLEKPKRTRTAKQGDLKDIKARVEALAYDLSIPDFSNFNGTINSNFGLMWDNRSNWEREDWEKVLTVVEGKK